MKWTQGFDCHYNRRGGVFLQKGDGYEKDTI